MLADDGFILLTRTQPIRYAVERAEQNGTSLGEEYFSTAPFSYLSGWNDQITLTKRPYTISDLINVFSEDVALEPADLLVVARRLLVPRSPSARVLLLAICLRQSSSEARLLTPPRRP